MPAAKTPRSKVVRDFGACVAARRRELGLSQTQLAERIGIGQDTLSRIESGLLSPKLHKLRDYADALHCPVFQLFRHAPEGDLALGEFPAELLLPLAPEWRETIKRMVVDMTINIRRTAELTERRNGEGGLNYADGQAVPETEPRKTDPCA